MIRKALIALAATTALGVSLVPAAQAKTNADFNVKLGFDGGYVVLGSPGYYDDGGYEDDCHYVKVKHHKWNKWHTNKITYFTKEVVCY